MTRAPADRTSPAPTLGRSVDWDVAASVGARLTRPAPPVTEYTRTQVIDELAAASRAAEPPVREVTGLHAEANQHVGELADFPMQVLIGQHAGVAGLAFPNDSSLVLAPSCQMAIQTVMRNV